MAPLGGFFCDQFCQPRLSFQEGGGLPGWGGATEPHVFGLF